MNSISHFKQFLKHLLPRHLQPKACAARLLREFASNSAVLAGPFRGLKCPSEEILSANFPKILGVYEMELHHIFRNHSFSTIINIGAAEGFYATGLAKLWLGCRVIAFEAEPSGREAIFRYADLNGVKDRIDVRGFCDHEAFQRVLFDLSGPDTLVLMDIEGGEDTLLAGKNIDLLAPCSILVELHDIRIQQLGEKLKSRFSATHEIQEIWTRPRTLNDFGFVKNLFLRLYLFQQLKDAADEKRGAPMRWFWMTPK